MSRLPRDCSDTNCFHVMVQGIAKENIFYTDELKNVYLYDINLFKKDDDVKVIAYCMMDNHCHLLLVVPDTEKLGHFMRRVNTRFAQYYNHKQNRVGYVFRDRFKSQAIFDTAYVANCLCYIHNNPVNAGIVRNPLDYNYSSFKSYINRWDNVDFDAAGELFDASAQGVMELHRELTYVEGCPEWIEVKEDSRTVEERACEILESYKLPPRYLRLDKEKLIECCDRLREAGMTYNDIAKVFEYNSANALRRKIK